MQVKINFIVEQPGPISIDPRHAVQSHIYQMLNGSEFEFLHKQNDPIKFTFTLPGIVSNRQRLLRPIDSIVLASLEPIVMAYLTGLNEKKLVNINGKILRPLDAQPIQQSFSTTYRTVTPIVATVKNPGHKRCRYVSPETEPELFELAINRNFEEKTGKPHNIKLIGVGKPYLCTYKECKIIIR